MKPLGVDVKRAPTNGVLESGMNDHPTENNYPLWTRAMGENPEKYEPSNQANYAGEDRLILAFLTGWLFIMASWSMVELFSAIDGTPTDMAVVGNFLVLHALGIVSFGIGRWWYGKEYLIKILYCTCWIVFSGALVSLAVRLTRDKSFGS